MVKYWILIAIVVSLAIVTFAIYNSSENFRHSSIYEYPSRCFDCEKDLASRFGDEYAWMGQNTKSFASENEMVERTGRVGAGVLAHPLKYY